MMCIQVAKNFLQKTKGWPVILHPSKKWRNKGKSNAITQPDYVHSCLLPTFQKPIKQSSH